MAISKLANQMLAEEVVKKSTPLLGNIGGAVGPGLNAFFIAKDVASGESSLGEALGEYGGMDVGYRVGSGVYNALVPKLNRPLNPNLAPLPEDAGMFKRLGRGWDNLKYDFSKGNRLNTLKRFGRGVGGLVAGLGTSVVGSMVGKKLMENTPIYKRKPLYGDNFNGAYTNE